MLTPKMGSGLVKNKDRQSSRIDKNPRQETETSEDTPNKTLVGINLAYFGPQRVVLQVGQILAP